jgi:TetR/AcrR family transcriptional regulator
MTPPGNGSPSKAERTRASILAHAQRLFAERGFTDTRLEDVADAVGLKRPALFYHFKDKQALYDAVIEDLFGDLWDRTESILTRSGPIPERLEEAISAWVDGVAARPAIARLILRNAADAQPHTSSAPPDGNRMLTLGRGLLEEGRRNGELKPIHDDFFHVWSSIVGSTVFFVAAMPSLMPDEEFDPLDPIQIEGHKLDVLRTARQLLGIPTENAS